MRIKVATIISEEEISKKTVKLEALFTITIHLGVGRIRKWCVPQKRRQSKKGKLFGTVRQWEQALIVMPEGL